MTPIKIREDIYWMGGIDWELRNFHGYLTQKGSTYIADTLGEYKKCCRKRRSNIYPGMTI